MSGICPEHQEYDPGCPRCTSGRTSSCLNCGRDLHHDERFGWLDEMNRTNCVESYRLHEPDEWYSDDALQKQTEVKRIIDAGRKAPLTLLFGLMEPRTQPEPHERCVNCGSDARDRAGGGESKGARWCSLCLDRGRDEDWIQVDVDAPNSGKGNPND